MPQFCALLPLFLLLFLCCFLLSSPVLFGCALCHCTNKIFINFIVQVLYIYIYIYTLTVQRTHKFFVNDKVISFLMVAHGRSLCRASSSSWPTRRARISSDRVGFKFIFITLYRSMLSLFRT